LLPISKTPYFNYRGRVLIVDDDQAIREMLSNALTISGYYVDVSTNALEGLHKALSTEYDVVLTDIVMPVVDGIAFCAQLHKKKPYATVVMISGFTDFNTVRKAFKQGVYDFIPKPVKMSDVELTLARAMERTRVKLIEKNYQEELKRRISQQAEKIKKTHLNAILALASALNAKDTYTQHHGQRVADVAVTIGARMNLESEILKSIGLAGLLHDIGKIGIPDSILNKKGALTFEEQRAIQRHPIVSHEIVSQMIDDPRVLEAILYHHERIDGTGYPRGLTGSEIPLTAAIISVADVYDALTSKRTYRDAYCPDMAKDVLRRHYGTRLYTKAVEALIEGPVGANDNARAERHSPITSTFVPQKSDYHQ